MADKKSHPEYANPERLGKPFSAYSHVAKAGDLVFVAGQVGMDVDNSVVGADVGVQTTQALENVRLALTSQGAHLCDVVRFVSYLVSTDDIPSFYAARDAYFAGHYPNGEFPPNTLLVVRSLVRDELRVEIDATARLG